MLRKTSPFRYILFYKPYGVVSQFIFLGSHKALKDFGPFPPNVYPVGRLDADSEGLLLLTDDDNVKHRLIDPKFRHPREYLAQVENTPDESKLEKLRAGIVLGGRKTLPADVKILTSEPNLPARVPPIRYRKSVPTAWIQLRLREGMNHQVRRMTAAVGHPTLRLVRTGIGFLSLNDLRPGEYRELSKVEISQLKTLLRSA